LLYLVKHSCPNISISVGDFAKVADSATEGHFKALLRAIKYVLGTEDHGLLLQPELNNNGFYL
jgi:phage antirepressor YoqD-like protein